MALRRKPPSGRLDKGSRRPRQDLTPPVTCLARRIGSGVEFRSIRPERQPVPAQSGWQASDVVEARICRHGRGNEAAAENTPFVGKRIENTCLTRRDPFFRLLKTEGRFSIPKSKRPGNRSPCRPDAREGGKPAFAGAHEISITQPIVFAERQS